MFIVHFIYKYIYILFFVSSNRLQLYWPQYVSRGEQALWFSSDVLFSVERKSRAYLYIGGTLVIIMRVMGGRVYSYNDDRVCDLAAKSWASQSREVFHKLMFTCGGCGGYKFPFICMCVVQASAAEGNERWSAVYTHDVYIIVAVVSSLSSSPRIPSSWRSLLVSGISVTYGRGFHAACNIYMYYVYIYSCVCVCNISVVHLRYEKKIPGNDMTWGPGENNMNMASPDGGQICMIGKNRKEGIRSGPPPPPTPADDRWVPGEMVLIFCHRAFIDIYFYIYVYVSVHL